MINKFAISVFSIFCKIFVKKEISKKQKKNESFIYRMY